MREIVPVFAAIFGLVSGMACLSLVLRIWTRSGIPVPSFLLSSTQLKALARNMTAEADPIDKILGIIMAVSFSLMVAMMALYYW